MRELVRNGAPVSLSLRALRRPWANKDCAESDLCANENKCYSNNGECVVGKDCAATPNALRLDCTYVNGFCAAITDDDCLGSEGCTNYGACTAQEGYCQAITNADCAGLIVEYGLHRPERGGTSVATPSAQSTLCAVDGLRGAGRGCESHWTAHLLKAAKKKVNAVSSIVVVQQERRRLRTVRPM